MKKLFRIIIAVVALFSFTTSVAYMTPTAEKTQQQQQKLEKQNKKVKKQAQQQKKTIQPKQQTIDKFASLRDEANVLSVNDRRAIEALLKSIEAKHKIRCAVVFTSNLEGMKIGKFANSLIDRYYTDGEKGNVVLVVDPKQRNYYFSTDNKMRQIILDGDKHGVGYLKKAFQPQLKKNKWAEAAKNYAKGVDELNSYYVKEGKALDPADEFNVIAAIAAIILAAVGAWIVRKSLIASMSNVAPAKTASEYLQKETINVQENRDVYLYTTTTVTHHEKSSSNDSTDSSHGGGGGSF